MLLFIVNGLSFSTIKEASPANVVDKRCYVGKPIDRSGLNESDVYFSNFALAASIRVGMSTPPCGFSMAELMIEAARKKHNKFPKLFWTLLHSNNSS